MTDFFWSKSYHSKNRNLVFRLYRIIFKKISFFAFRYSDLLAFLSKLNRITILYHYKDKLINIRHITFLFKYRLCQKIQISLSSFIVLSSGWLNFSISNLAISWHKIHNYDTWIYGIYERIFVKRFNIHDWLLSEFLLIVTKSQNESSWFSVFFFYFIFGIYNQKYFNIISDIEIWILSTLRFINFPSWSKKKFK